MANTRVNLMDLHADARELVERAGSGEPVLVCVGPKVVAEIRRAGDEGSNASMTSGLSIRPATLPVATLLTIPGVRLSEAVDLAGVLDDVRGDR